MAVGKSVIVKLSIVAGFVSLFAVLSLVGSKQRAAASAFGPSPSYTNAPGESNCTACHTGSDINTGPGMVEITGIPATYTSGQQFNVVVTATQADAVIYGFQFTAISAATGGKIGTYSIPPASNGRIQVLQGLIGGTLLREYMEHTSGGLSNGQFGFNSWSFTWTAPATSAGRVDFYATANCANSDGNTGGDSIYSTSRSTVPVISGTVTIGGKVTSPSGISLRNVKVILTNSLGVQTTTSTSSLGIYSFANVPPGSQYTISASSKRYRFAPRILTPNANATDLDLVGLE